MATALLITIYLQTFKKFLFLGEAEQIRRNTQSSFSLMGEPSRTPSKTIKQRKLCFMLESYTLNYIHFDCLVDIPTRAHVDKRVNTGVVDNQQVPNQILHDHHSRADIELNETIGRSLN